MDETAKQETPAFPGAALVDVTIPRVPKLWEYLGRKMGLKKGTRMHVREQGNRYFISPGLEDTLCFPVDHPTHARQPRWAWSDDPDAEGIQFGVAIVLPATDDQPFLKKREAGVD